MNSLKDFCNNHEKTFILIGIDLFLLGVFLFFEPKFFIYLFLLNIITLLLLIPLLILYLPIKLQISSKEYYFKTVETSYMHMNDENILIKMFEIRISNFRQFIFSYLVLIATLVLTVAFNQRAYEYFDNPTFDLFGFSKAKIIIVSGAIGLLSLILVTFGLDRLTLIELKTLFKAKERLKQLKETNLNIENTILSFNRIMTNIDYDDLENVVDKAIKNECCICFNCIKPEQSKYIQKIAEDRLSDSEIKINMVIFIAAIAVSFTVPFITTREGEIGYLAGVIIIIFAIFYGKYLCKPRRNTCRRIILDVEKRLIILDAEERRIILEAAKETLSTSS